MTRDAAARTAIPKPFGTFATALLSVSRRISQHNTLSAGGVTMQLLLKEAGTAATGNGTCHRTYERHWTPVHLSIWTSMLTTWTRRLPL